MSHPHQGKIIRDCAVQQGLVDPGPGPGGARRPSGCSQGQCEYIFVMGDELRFLCKAHGDWYERYDSFDGPIVWKLTRLV